MASSPPKRRLVGSSPTLDVPKFSFGEVLKNCHVPCNIEKCCAVGFKTGRWESVSIELQDYRNYFLLQNLWAIMQNQIVLYNQIYVYLIFLFSVLWFWKASETKLFYKSDLFLIFQFCGFKEEVGHQKWGRNAVCQNVKVGMILSLLILP